MDWMQEQAGGVRPVQQAAAGASDPLEHQRAVGAAEAVVVLQRDVDLQVVGASLAQ